MVRSRSPVQFRPTAPILWKKTLQNQGCLKCYRLVYAFVFRLLIFIPRKSIDIKRKRVKDKSAGVANRLSIDFRKTLE